MESTSESGGAALAALVLEWREVAVFFMLRQVLAPCVESVLLLDRLLYLREQGACIFFLYIVASISRFMSHGRSVVCTICHVCLICMTLCVSAGYCAQLVAAFDPVLSPRNLVITSHKTPSENQDPR